MISENNITIYFLLNEHNELKIGMTNNVERRTNELLTGSATQLTLLYIIEDVPQSFEDHVHGLCSKYNINREWFRPECIEQVLLRNPYFSTNMKKIRKKR